MSMKKINSNVWLFPELLFGILYCVNSGSNRLVSGVVVVVIIAAGISAMVKIKKWEKKKGW